MRVGRSRFRQQQFRAVREAIPVSRYVRDMGIELKKSGARWRGKCPVCGHGENSEALSVGDERGLWHCFACNAGGDLIVMAELVEGFEGPHFALVALAERYGVDLPQRPDAWYRKQERKARLREALDRKRREVKRRRLFRVVMVPFLDSVGATEAEVRAAWEDFKNLPLP